MRKLKSITVLLLMILSSFAFSQELGEFKPKDDSYKASKLNDGPKKLYIASFNVNFEVYKEAVDKKAAGGFGRTVKSAAKAKAAVGLATLDKDAVQSKVDQLYAEFVSEMTSKGYEIISADDQSAKEYHQKWEKATGPSVYEAGMTGIVGFVPSGFSYYYKERNIFSDVLSTFSKHPQNLSKALNDALVIDVSLAFVFSELGTDWNVGNQAKVKLLVNYRMANLFGNSSHINFTRGKMKIGGNPESFYNGYMKSDLEIGGVLAKEKVVAYSTQTQKTATSLNPIVSVSGENYSQTTKWLEPDGKKYAEGMYLAGSKFIKFHLEAAFK